MAAVAAGVVPCADIGSKWDLAVMKLEVLPGVRGERGTRVTCGRADDTLCALRAAALPVPGARSASGVNASAEASHGAARDAVVPVLTASRYLRRM